MDDEGWRGYLEGYHADNPGITETVLERADHPILGTPHRWLASAVPPDAATVVDVACGSAPIQSLISAPDLRYLGVDLSDAELRRAIQAGRGPVVRADAVHLPVAPESVDALVVSMALMLLPLDEALTEFARVLRTDSTLAVMVPSVWPVQLRDLPGVAALSATLLGPGSMPQQLGVRSLASAMQAAGFHDVQAQRVRFELRIREPQDAQLAVNSLYTPGRSAWQRRLAAGALQRLPGATPLPVPLLRVVARRR